MYFSTKNAASGIFVFFLINLMLCVNCPICSADVLSDRALDNTPLANLSEFQLEQSIRKDLNRLKTKNDFVLAIRARNGKTFIHSTNRADEYTMYESASTSKMVAAAVILSVVKDGKLCLDDHPQDYISEWPVRGNLSKVKLRHLLNLTSGIITSPFCFAEPDANFEECISEMIETSRRRPERPGKEFIYSTAQFQVAGLMAVNASGESSWKDLFEKFKRETGLFPSCKFDMPSEENPRLAAGMHWNVSEYMDFLEAIYYEKILSPELIEEMTSDQLGKASPGNFPFPVTSWHYGFGCWVECSTIQNNCDERTRVSSPGVHGSYPFIDYEYQYFGIIAQKDKVKRSNRGYFIYREVAEKLEAWALMNQK